MTSPALFSSPPLVNNHRLLPPRLSSPCACSFHSHSIRISTTTRLTLPSIKSASDSATAVNETSTTPSISASLISEPTADEAAAAKVGARVRVKVPLKVYHVPKTTEVELEGMEGTLKQYVAVWKGKNISANLPYKIEFFAKVEGRDAPVKFFAHLKEDEFEYID